MSICAWCKVELPGSPESHGVCLECAEAMMLSLLPVGARVCRNGRSGEVVRHLQHRVLVLWDNSNDEAVVERPSQLAAEVAQ